MLRARTRILATTASVLALAGPAFAQQAASPAASDSASTPAVDEVVVTATRRDERLQNVPIAVSAISANAFQDSGYKDPKDLQFLSPSVQISTQGGNGIFIRGAGTASTNGGTDQSVGMVIDGVLMGFIDDVGGDLTDLDHIEVLRGPQGTQFGKNASAGLVSVITKRPSLSDYSVSTYDTYGEHNDTNAQAVVNMPLGQDFAARFSARYTYRDGVFPNIATGANYGSSNGDYLTGKLLWQPTDRASVYIKLDWRSQDIAPNFIQSYRNVGLGFTSSGQQFAPPGLGVVGVGVTPSPSNVDIASPSPDFRRTNTGGVSAEVNYPVGELTLTSISAYRTMDRTQSYPTTAGAIQYQFLTNNYTGSQASQELRLTSPQSARFSYFVGLFLYDRDTNINQVIVGPEDGLAAFLHPGVVNPELVTNGGTVYSQNDSKSGAVFTDATYHLTDKLFVGAGIRYTVDRVSANATTVPGPANWFVAPFSSVKPTSAGTYNTSGVTYRIGPQYFFTPNVQVYATLAHGYKGPIADTSTAAVEEVLPETNDDVELGLKSEWLQHRLVLNLTAFNEQFHNFQTQVLNLGLTPPAFALGNAPGALNRGVEFEFTARPTGPLTLDGGLTYLDAHYTNFVTSCFSTAAPIKPTTCFTEPGTTLSAINADGDPEPNASRWTVRLAANYKHSLTNALWLDASADYIWRSQFNTVGYDPNTVVAGYGVAGFNVTVGDPKVGWRLGLFARNLFNQHFLNGIAPSFVEQGSYTNVLDPESVRTVGLVFGYSWH